MKAVLLLMLVSSCFAGDAEAERVRARLQEARAGRWAEHYQPTIDATCREEPESVRCAWARVEAKKAFDEEEQQGQQLRSSAANERFKEERAARRRERERRMTCITTGAITVCD